MLQFATMVADNQDIAERPEVLPHGVPLDVSGNVNAILAALFVLLPNADMLSPKIVDCNGETFVVFEATTQHHHMIIRVRDGMVFVIAHLDQVRFQGVPTLRNGREVFMFQNDFSSILLIDIAEGDGNHFDFEIIAIPHRAEWDYHVYFSDVIVGAGTITVKWMSPPVDDPRYVPFPDDIVRNGSVVIETDLF